MIPQTAALALDDLLPRRKETGSTLATRSFVPQSLHGPLLERAAREEALLGEDYRTALSLKYPKGAIQRALAPDLFGGELVSRTHDPSKQVFGLTFSRFLYRLVGLLGRLVEILPVYSEEASRVVAEQLERLLGPIEAHLKAETEISAHELALRLEPLMGEALDALKGLVGLEEILENEDAEIEINQAAYLLTLYRHGLEHSGVFWLCVPAPVDDTPALVAHDEDDDEDDRVQFHPQVEHRLAREFFRQLASAGSLQTLFGRESFWVGFHRHGGVPKGFSRLVRDDGAPVTFWLHREARNTAQ
jgi:hypothetical protein